MFKIFLCLFVLLIIPKNITTIYKGKANICKVWKILCRSREHKVPLPPPIIVRHPVTSLKSRGQHSYFIDKLADRFEEELNRFEQTSSTLPLSGISQTSNSALTCPKLGLNKPDCRNKFQILFHKCWNSTGSPDLNCGLNEICCFNGCQNVCYGGLKQITMNHKVKKCPKIEKFDAKRCVDSTPNCWNVGKNDLDCEDRSLCCFDGCTNRCVVKNNKRKNELKFKKTQYTNYKNKTNQNLIGNHKSVVNFKIHNGEDKNQLRTHSEAMRQKIPFLIMKNTAANNYLSKANRSDFLSTNDNPVIQPNLFYIIPYNSMSKNVSQDTKIARPNKKDDIFKSRRKIDYLKRCPFTGRKHAVECLSMKQQSCSTPNRSTKTCKMCCFNGCIYACLESSSQPDQSRRPRCPNVSTISCHTKSIAKQNQCIDEKQDCPEGYCCFDGCNDICLTENKNTLDKFWVGPARETEEYRLRLGNLPIQQPIPNTLIYDAILAYFEN